MDKFSVQLSMADSSVQSPSSSGTAQYSREEVAKGAQRKYQRLGDYDKKLRRIKYKALVVAGFQKLARFLGICAVSWATVVLLGGFASSMLTIDFYFVSILVLVEAGRLSTTLVFSKLTTKKMFEEEPHPEHFLYEDKQPKWVTEINFLGQVAHLIFAAASIVLACVRFGLSRLQNLELGPAEEKNLRPALYIFYITVFLNSFTAIVSVLCSLAVTWRFDRSLLSYHDEVFRRALDVGLVEADEFNFFDFAFRKLGDDYMRNMQPLFVKKDNQELIEYLYRHPKGVEIVCQYLKSDDTFKQQAAANLPGFWVGEERIELQGALLSMLADKLGGAGKVAVAAANSFSVLARKWATQDPRPVPSPLLAIFNKRGMNVVDIIVGQMLNRVNPSLLLHLRVLESFCCSEEVVARIHETWTKSEVEVKLRGIIRAPNVDRPRQRTRIYAASALHKLLGGKLGDPDITSIQGIDPSELREPYLWDHEQKTLDDLRQDLGLERYRWPTNWPTDLPPFIRQAPR